MKASLKIGSVAGIGIYLHFTFLILLAWLGVSYYLVHHRAEDAVAGLGFILALFSIVVLHELGHALTAKKFGIQTRDITLLPIGGVARLERIPDDPKQELLVALAGPAVNVVLALVFFIALGLQSGFSTLGEVHLSANGAHFLVNMFWVNVSLALFNLLPAFPMDGGRVLRALLAMRMDYARATNIAARIGQSLAWMFGIVGLFTPNAFLVFIAFFVWIGAAQEARQAQIKSALGGLPVGAVMISEFRALSPEETLAGAVEHVLAGCQQDFPVVDGGNMAGMLTQNDLLNGLAKEGKGALVKDFMQRSFQLAAPTEMAESVLSRLQEGECRTVAVLDKGHVIGLVTPEHLGEYLLIQAALDESNHQAPNLRTTAGYRHRHV